MKSGPATDAGQPRVDPTQEPLEPLGTERIDEIEFNPATADAGGIGAGRIALWTVGGLLALVLLAILWFVFSARSVHINVAPQAQTQSFDSSRFQFQLGDRYLTLPGEATVVATLDGYYPLREVVTVDDQSNQMFNFTLQKKPGFLTIEFDRDVRDPRIEVGEVVFDGLRAELEPGEYALSIVAPRYAPFSQAVEIEGGEVEQSLLVSLVPDWADVTFESMPVGAQIVVDGDVLGTTPGTVEILAGVHDVRLQAPGHKAWRRPVRAIANVPQRYDGIVLEKADGLLSIGSTPSAASVSVDGRYRGQTPLDLRLPPAKTYAISVSRSGYETATRRVTVREDRDVALNLSLNERFGAVVFDLEPANAQVFVDGVEQTLTKDGLNLAAVNQSIEIRAPGFVSQTREIVPNPAYAQTVTAKLITLEKAREAALKRSLTTGDGQTLVLMRPFPFQMGSSRRERGRRSNEVLREVDGLGEFYLSTLEVTNKRFKAFRREHESGFVYKQSLDDADSPVVNVTVADAVAYCNWLSEKDDLEPAYKITQDGWERIGGSGYRLPTEAEWAFAARYAGRVKPTRYPWGKEMPPPADSGNFADRAAIGLTSITLKKYSDGFPATAPVGTFGESDAGLFDIAGNVAEWTHTEYAAGVAPGGVDGTGTYYVIRGSSWMHSDLSELRLAFRDFSDEARPDVGFRIARDLEEPEL